MDRDKSKERAHAITRPTANELLAARERMNSVRVECVKVDLETALTFAKIARQTHDDLRKQRICSAARKAYDVVVTMIQKVELTADDRGEVKRGLMQLQSELRALGETF